MSDLSQTIYVGTPFLPVIPGHRYWRLLISQTPTNNSVNIAEVELRTSSGGADQTGSGTATGNGVPAGGTPAAVVDNDPSSTWHSPIGTMPAWWAYDFGVGVTKNIVEVAIQAHPSNPAYSPSIFDVQYSDDNSAWTTKWSEMRPTLWTNNEIRVFTEPAVGSTSYFNPGGRGARTSTITVTMSVPPAVGFVTNWVDGVYGNNTWFNAGNSSVQILFDFGVGVSKVIDELTWYQDITAAQGTWVMEGSNDNSSYTTFSGSIALGAAAIVQVPFTNSTGYRYYRLRQTAGVTSNSPYIQEIEFKIK